MAVLSKLRALQALYEDLAGLAASERVEAGRAEAERRGKPAGVRKVSVPWAGDWWLGEGQRAVVRELAEALGSRSHDIDERVLAERAGMPGRKMRDVFAGVEGWERLVVRGQRAGTYRLAAPPEAQEDAGEVRRVVPEE